MTTHWHKEATESLGKAFSSAAAALTAQGAPTRHYVVPDCHGYAPITGGAADVWCLEVDFGAALRQPGESLVGVFQAFDPAHPHLGFAFLGQRRVDGTPVSNHRLPRWRYRQDNLFCYTFMPTVNDLLAPLDPTGKGSSQIVGVYHGSITAPDYLSVPRKVATLRNDARRQGQHAVVWADFRAPFSEAAVRLVRRSLQGSWPIHLIPRAAQASRIRVPTRLPDGTIGYFEDFSASLDKAIILAQDYLAGRKAA
ncbi:hypothetical protein [Streptomyces sp. NPDC054849]